MQLVLPYLIHEDQTGFMQGRNIAENIISLQNAIHLCEKENINAMIMAVDFQKAFHRVEWSSMYEILRAFNFGPNFIRLVQICYTDIKSAVLNQGSWSEFFKLGRSVKQGCPLSGSLFLLVIEVIGLKTCQNRNIKDDRSSEDSKTIH